MNLKVADRFPLRVYAGYDNAGVPTIGTDQVFGGFEWANVFGLDQRFSYQYTTDTEFEKYQSHLASYVIPLPWHDELTISGNFAEVSPDFGLYGKAFEHLHVDDGMLYQLSVRYTMPLPQWGSLKQNLTLGFDYKHVDTPLFFGSGLLSTNLIDVAQFTLGYQALLPDRYGNTALSLQGVVSPGDLTDNDTDGAYHYFMQNPNAHASYVYGDVEIRRETLLPAGFTWVVRAMGQLADGTIPASEAFGVGGFSSVRGYDERTATGDEGWLIQNELRTPQFVVSNLTRQKGAKDWIQGLVFFDYGGVLQVNPTAGQAGNDQLASVGAGVRCQIADNMHVRVDYGFQLDRSYLSDKGNLLTQDAGQFNIGVEVSY